MWDDNRLENRHFAYLFPLFDPRDMDRVEAEFLRLLGFECVCKASTYAHYYFSLRDLCHSAGLSFPLKPISRNGKHRLEQRSRKVQAFAGHDLNRTL